VCVRPEGRKAIAELKHQAAETVGVEADAVIMGDLTPIMQRFDGNAVHASAPA
jgi:hypothetical protein